jgi:hypothetical protein
MRRGALLCAVLLAAGCALLRPQPAETQKMREIVGDAVSAARASPEEQKRRLAHAQQMYVAVPDEANRVRLAAYFATLPPPWRDELRAATLLEPLAGHEPRSPVAELAGMLAATLAERQRLVRDLRAAEQRAEAAEQRAQAAERREEAVTERANTLQKQVEALKSIERGILEREERRRTLQR